MHSVRKIWIFNMTDIRKEKIYMTKQIYIILSLQVYNVDLKVFQFFLP